MMQAARIGPDARGWLETTGSNVVSPGDTLSVWTDARTRHARRIQVSTTFQGNAVALTATFNTLASGLTYMAYAEVTVPAKQLSVQVQNYDYSGPGGGAASAAYEMGAIYTTLPGGCLHTVVSGATYYLCGNAWLQPTFGANGVYFRVVPHSLRWLAQEVPAFRTLSAYRQRAGACRLAPAGPSRDPHRAGRWRGHHT